MKNKEHGYTAIELMALIAIITLLIVIPVGWVKNIIKLSECNFEKPYKAEVIRGVGVPVIPMGAIVEYMDIEDN
jgi:hypothetical protein